TFEPVTEVLSSVLLPKVFGKKYAEGTDEDFANYTPETKVIPFRILKEFTGDKLVDTRYEQLVPWFTPNDNPENAFRVILGEFVTTEDGTGIVHTAPTFGADDARVAKMAQPEVPPMLVKDENDNLVPLVDLQGKFIKGENVPAVFSGTYIKNEY